MIQIFIAIFIIFFSLLTFLPSKNLPWNWPLMQLLPTAYLKSHELYDKLTQVLSKNKGTIHCKTSSFSNSGILVTCDPSNVHHVMNSKFSNYQRGLEFRKAFDFLGDAVFVKDIDEWKLGKKFTHGFYKESEFHNPTPKILRHTLEKGLIPILHHMSEKGETRGVFDLQVHDGCNMLDGYQFRLGFSSCRVPQCALLEAMDAMGEAVFWPNILPEKVWKVKKWLGMGKEKKMKEACIVLNKVLDEFVSKKQEMIAFNQMGDDFDVLKYYMASDESSKGDDQKKFLTANIMTLFFAGRDTSTAILTWFFHLISTNPRVKNTILEEMKHNFPPQQHVFANVEELSKLVYLHSALTEKNIK